MAKKYTLKAEPRARTGSGLLKQMRREGWLPSVMYGTDIEPKNLKVEAKAFNEMLAQSESDNILINLDLKGEGSSLAFLQAVQHDPLNADALHADFLAVTEKTELNASLPVHLLGEPVGVKEGGILEQVLHALEITCKATHLPEYIELDVSGLDEGDTLTIGDITMPQGVVSHYEDDVVIASIVKPAAIVSEEDAEADTEEGEETAEGDAAESEADAEDKSEKDESSKD